MVNLTPRRPATDAPEDQAAARRADAYLNRLFLDPLFLGQYPEELTEMFGPAWPEAPADEMARIAAGRPDFVGVNYYLRETVRDAPQAWPARAENVRQAQSTYTEMGWEVYPPGLTDTLLWVAETYGGPPLWLTENGAAFYDPPTARDGRVHDPLRVRYLRDHVAAVAGALARGADVRGYFAWSPARQRRVGARHLQALRTRPRRFRDAGADAQGQRPRLRRDRPHERHGTGGTDLLPESNPSPRT